MWGKAVAGLPLRPNNILEEDDMSEEPKTLLEKQSVAWMNRARATTFPRRPSRDACGYCGVRPEYGCRHRAADHG